MAEGAIHKLIVSMAARLQLENAVSRFSAFLVKTFPNRKSYIGIKYMQECLSKPDTDRDMQLILAVTLRHYLKEIFPLEVVKNSLLRKKERLGLLKKIRSVHQTLFCKE